MDSPLIHQHPFLSKWWSELYQHSLSKHPHSNTKNCRQSKAPTECYQKAKKDINSKESRPQLHRNTGIKKAHASHTKRLVYPSFLNYYYKNDISASSSLDSSSSSHSLLLTLFLKCQFNPQESRIPWNQLQSLEDGIPFAWMQAESECVEQIRYIILERLQFESGIENQDQLETLTQLIYCLKEPNIELIQRVLQRMGSVTCVHLLDDTLNIEQQGGLTTQDGLRRTTGGVFLYLLRKRITPEDRKFIWGPQVRKQRQMKQNVDASKTKN